MVLFLNKPNKNEAQLEKRDRVITIVEILTQTALIFPFFIL